VKRNEYKILVGTFGRKEFLGNINVNEKIVLKLISK
jgi:hypothetical protein